MGGSQQLDVRADLTVGADANLGDVESRQVVVGEAARAEVDVLTVVDVQRRLDDGILSEFSEEFGQQRAGAVRIVEEGPVVGVSQPGPALGDPGALRVVGDVEVPGEHPFPVRAGVPCEVVSHGVNGIGRA